jgi:hypothetical protein
MTTKPFPTPPTPQFLLDQERNQTHVGYGGTEVPPRTACKHGKGECEVCGTSDLRDIKHTTKGGKGLVARLRGKS